MREQRHKVGGGSDMLKDYAVLSYILESHLIQKNEWRQAVGASPIA
jgi:hypothetical protein